MFITHSGKMALYKRFPHVELSYENTCYKKVHNADLYLAIPSKNKSFAWFTYYKNKNICVIIIQKVTFNLYNIKKLLW